MKRRRAPVCAFCRPLWASDVRYCTTAAQQLLYFNFPANTFVSLGGGEWLTPKVSSWVTNEFIFINRSQAVLRLAKIIYPFLRLGCINSSHFCSEDYYQRLLPTSLRRVFLILLSQTCRNPNSVHSVWDKTAIAAPGRVNKTRFVAYALKSNLLN